MNSRSRSVLFQVKLGDSEWYYGYQHQLELEDNDSSNTQKSFKLFQVHCRIKICLITMPFGSNNLIGIISLYYYQCLFLEIFVSYNTNP